MSKHVRTYSHAGMETPKLERGKSILHLNRGRTSRERISGKQARRAARIVERSIKANEAPRVTR